MTTIFGSRQCTKLKAVLLCCAALVLPASPASALTPVKLGTPIAHPTSPDTFRVLTFNTWTDRYASKLSDLNEFMRMGDYDLVGLQEPRTPSNYVTQWPGVLSAAGIGTYTASQQSDTGILSRLPGTFFTSNPITDPGHSNFTAMTLDATSDRPQFIFASTHLQYYDASTLRMPQAQMIGAWAKKQTMPVLLVGDFNAGDVSERGLERASQIALMLPTGKTNTFYHTLLTEYATAADPVNGAQNLENYLNKLPGAKPPVFQDETYPVTDNTPVTMNVLKKTFIMLQLPSEREHFAPLAAGDGASTWTSVLADSTNTWPSWDHLSIDHFLVSRPFGKWWALKDDPSDTYLGVLSKVDHVDYTNGTTDTMSDHDLVAHTMRWIGPILQNMTVGTTSLVRLVWNASASTFAENGGVFVLSRNNMRTDVYLGQIADDSGNPTMTGLTIAQKETVLNCASTDATLQAAIQSYCIDDHSTIGETLVNDKGTVAVTEDLALGSPTATLRLGNGTLRIDGTAMTSLNRPVSLEAGNGTIAVSDATNVVTIPTIVSGVGGLHKAGPGGLVLGGTNTYAGMTNVDAGLLRVDGSIVSASTVNAGGTLEARGTIADTTVNTGGALKVDLGGTAGALTLAGGVATVDGTIGNAIINTGTLTIDSGGAGSTVTVSGGHAEIDGSVAAVTVNASGTLSVSANANAGTIATNGGNAMINGVVTNATIAGGSTLEVGTGGNTLAANVTDGLFKLDSDGVAGSVTASGNGIASIDGAAGDVILNAGGILNGRGSMQSLVVNAGGIVAPGHSIGTIHVNGDATYNPGSIYQVEIDADGNSDSIGVDGTAHLNGGTVAANASAVGEYQPQTHYQIITAKAVAGAFDKATSTRLPHALARLWAEQC